MKSLKAIGWIVFLPVMLIVKLCDLTVVEPTRTVFSKIKSRSRYE